MHANDAHARIGMEYWCGLRNISYWHRTTALVCSRPIPLLKINIPLVPLFFFGVAFPRFIRLADTRPIGFPARVVQRRLAGILFVRLFFGSHAALTSLEANSSRVAFRVQRRNYHEVNGLMPSVGCRL
jgi:hypothetical protein